MARGNPQASGAAGQSNANANEYNANANSLFGSLAPTLESEVAHPAGFTPEDEAAMETGALQSAGGGQAAAVGQGGLLGARTRNKGAAAEAIPASARVQGQDLSQNLLGIQGANAKLKNEQQQEGISGLTNLTGLETGATNTALGNVAPLVNANTGAANSSWDWAQDTLDPLLSAGGNAASGYLSK